MGAYLSKPNCEKVSEDFDGEFLRFGSSSMQGWRISQEDAHSCIIDFDSSNGTGSSLFGVYDGHGGSEVAQYTAEKFPNFLKNVPAYSEGNMAAALENAFLGFDATLTADDVKQQLAVLAGGAKDEEDEDDEEVQNETAMLREEAVMPIEKLLERYGGTACIVNRPVTAIKKQSAKKNLSPVIRPKESNPTLVESVSPLSDCGAEKSDLQGSVLVENSKSDDICVNLADKVLNGCCDGAVNGVNDLKEVEVESVTSASNDVVKEIKDDIIKTACKDLKEIEDDNVKSASKDVEENKEDSIKATGNEIMAETSNSTSESDVISRPTGENQVSNGMKPETVNSISADVTASVSECTVGSSTSVSSICSSSQNDDAVEGSSSGSCGGAPKAEDSEEETTDEEDDSDSDCQWKEGQDDDDDDSDDEGLDRKGNDEDDEDDDDEDDDDDDEDDAEEMEEGMDFGEEPGADSGCTAVVALLHGNELYVANAGDSRCVLCRDGKAVEMSIDHKPEDDSELSRIVKAGGRVTEDGRVNGGLNLSRAIGDHIYKRNTAVSDREQMITSLPDVKSVTIEEADQFMVLACDGIWNVMSSQDVVDFVKRRLDSGVTKLSTICEEMFEFCLAPDTTGDGTGCDNMTCVIVTFSGLTTSVFQRTRVKRKADDIDDETECETKRLKVGGDDD